MEGITYRKDIEETIERYKKRVAKNPEDEIAKEVLQDLEWELRLIDRKEMMDKMREEEPDRWTFFMVHLGSPWNAALTFKKKYRSSRKP